MPALGEDQAAVDDYVFGYGTAVDIVKLDLAYPDVLVQDKPLPREDGQSMGIDRLGGRTINLELEILGVGEGDALELLSDLTDAFMGDNARQQPQTYQVLSYLLHGTGEQRRVFGRGRACAPATLENVHVGFIPVAAQFQTITPHVYSDAEHSDWTGLVPDDTGGLQGYLIGAAVRDALGGGHPRLPDRRVPPGVVGHPHPRPDQRPGSGNPRRVLVPARPDDRRRGLGAGRSAAVVTAGAPRIGRGEPGRVPDRGECVAGRHAGPTRRSGGRARGWDPTGTSGVDVFWRTARSSR